MNVLAVGAHFNNIEIGCGGTLIRHVQNGDKVILYVATSSGFLNPERVAVGKDEAVFEDGREAAAIIGGKLICGGFETLKLEFDDALNVSLLHLIEKEKIDLIYTHHSSDPKHDHRSLAAATIHAGRHVPRILAYRCSRYPSDVPFAPNFYVDVTDTWEKKIAAIAEYHSKYGKVDENKLEFIKNDAINNGFAMGVKYAEGFRCIRWLEN